MISRSVASPRNPENRPIFQADSTYPSAPEVPILPRPLTRKAPRHEGSPSGNLACTVGLLLLAAWWMVYIIFNVFYRADDLDQKVLYRVSSTVTAIPTLLFGALGLLYVPRALRVHSKARPTWFVPLLIYTIWALCSLIWTNDVEMCLRKNVSFLWTLLGAFGIGAGIFGTLRNGLSTFAKATVGAAAMLSLAYLWQIASDLTLSNILDPAWLPPYRVVGALLCETIVIAMLALSGLLIRSRRTLAVWMFVFLLPLLIIKARTAILMAIVLPLIVNLVRIRKSRTSRSAFILGGVFALFAIVVLFAVTGPLSSIIDITVPDSVAVYLERTQNFSQRGSLTIRYDLWAAVWPDIRDHFWFGNGFGSYWNDQRIRSISSVMREYLPFAHNGYIEELLAGGVIGLGLCLWFWGAAIVAVLKKAVGGRRPYCLFLLGSIAFILAYNWVDSLFQYYTRVCLVFVLTGLFALSAHGAEFDAEEPGERVKQPRQSHMRFGDRPHMAIRSISGSGYQRSGRPALTDNTLELRKL